MYQIQFNQLLGEIGIHQDFNYTPVWYTLIKKSMLPRYSQKI